MMNHNNFAAWDVKVIDSETSTMKDILWNIVEWGILAPSSHNVQPWRFLINTRANFIDVCLFEGGVLKYSDPKGRQAHISIGCLITNIIKAAKYYDLEPDVDFCPEGFYPLPLVRIKFNPRNKSTKDEDILKAIRDRRVNRGKFDPLKPIPTDFLERIKKIAINNNIHLSTVTDPLTRFAIAEVQYLADRAVIAINNFRTELAQFLLPNDTDRGIGMPGNTFGLSDDMSKYVHEELKKAGSFDPDLAFGIAASGRDGIKSSPLVGIISVSKDLPLWWIKAGMAFQEIAIETEKAGLAMAVHAAIVEVEMFNNVLRLRLIQKDRPTVIFRVGFATEERVHSPRIPVEELIEIIDPG